MHVRKGRPTGAPRAERGQTGVSHRPSAGGRSAPPPPAASPRELQTPSLLAAAGVWRTKGKAVRPAGGSLRGRAETHLGGNSRLCCRRRRRRSRRLSWRPWLAPGRRGCPTAQALLLQHRGEGAQGGHRDAAVRRPTVLRARAERLPPARQAPAVKAVLPRQLQQTRGRLRREGCAAHIRESSTQALLVRHARHLR